MGFGDWWGSVFGGADSSMPSSNIDALNGVGYGTSAMSAPASAGMTGGGGGSWFSDLMGGVGAGARAVTPLLGIGTAGLGLYSGIKGMQDAADMKEQNRESMDMQRSAASTALGSGSALTNAGTAAMMGGPLPEGLEAQAQQWEDAYRAQVRTYLAKAGQTTSTAMTQWEPYIKQQAAMYRQQLAGGLLQPGTSNLNVASGAASRAVGHNQATQTGVGGALEAANRALASLAAASGDYRRPEQG
jgi:hypothetical protein